MHEIKTVDISRLSHQGEGIAFVDESTWFVAKALPGEQVEAQALQKRGRNVFARCSNVVQPSKQRIEAHCPLHASCGGCDLQHMSIADQREHKSKALCDQLTRLGKIEQRALTAEPIIGDTWGYRERARFTLERQADQIHLAYRAPASRSPIRVQNCPVLHPQLEAALPRITDWANKSEASLINKELRIALGDDGRVGIAVDGRGIAAPFEGPIIDGRGQAINEQPTLHYQTIDNLNIAFSAADFTQVNRALNQQVTERLLRWLRPEGQRVLELFCGIGNFSLPLASRAAELVAIDSQQKQLDRAAHNAKQNNLQNIQFIRADLYKRVKLDIDEYTPVLADPPRTGLGDVLPKLLKGKPPRIAYLSCDSASFAKDAGKLVQGGYALTQLSYVDFFAQTGKIEAMGLFERST